jgi:hypothetical protein
MAITVGGKIEDPDSIDYEIALYTAPTSKELVIDTTNYIIKLTRTGNLTEDGITLKCLYSKLIEIWATDAVLITLPFPINPITDESFEFINGWNLDNTINSTTKISVTSCTGYAGQYTLVTSGNFNDENVFVDAYIIGANIAPGAKVYSIDSNTQISLTQPHVGDVYATATFYSDLDYTYNLIRTSGWAVKANVGAPSSEEYAGVVGLGSFGAQGKNKTLAVTGTITSNAAILVADTSSVKVGSFVAGVNVPYGTRVVSVDSNAQFTVSKTISSMPSGALVTLRSEQRSYAQIGESYYPPVYAIQHGPSDQPIKIYGNLTHGNYDIRTPNVAQYYLREQGYTHSQISLADIGYSTLTYQVYRGTLSNELDIHVADNDSAISIDGITVTGSPYDKMSITWYDTPQARVINGTTCYFSVIIDADTTAETYGTATIDEIYTYVQWALRRDSTVDIDAGTGSKIGLLTRELLRFVGDTLYTLYDSSDGGVYIDHFKLTDINNLVFADDSNQNRSFSYVAFGKFIFNNYLLFDAENAKYSLFYKQINQASSSKAFGTRDAEIVQAFSFDPMGVGMYNITGNFAGSTTTISFDYDHDSNAQCAWLPFNSYNIDDEYYYKVDNVTTWYRIVIPYISSSTWIPVLDGVSSIIIEGPSVVLVAIGLQQAQYISQEGVIARSDRNTIYAVAQIEKNYAA